MDTKRQQQSQGTLTNAIGNQDETTLEKKKQKRRLKRDQKRNVKQRQEHVEKVKKRTIYDLPSVLIGSIISYLELHVKKGVRSDTFICKMWETPLTMNISHSTFDITSDNMIGIDFRKMKRLSKLIISMPLSSQTLKQTTRLIRLFHVYQLPLRHLEIKIKIKLESYSHIEMINLEKTYDSDIANVSQASRKISTLEYFKCDSSTSCEKTILCMSCHTYQKWLKCDYKYCVTEQLICEKCVTNTVVRETTNYQTECEHCSRIIHVTCSRKQNIAGTAIVYFCHQCAKSCSKCRSCRRQLEHSDTFKCKCQHLNLHCGNCIMNVTIQRRGKNDHISQKCAACLGHNKFDDIDDGSE
jgi:hypothetical protein